MCPLNYSFAPKKMSMPLWARAVIFLAGAALAAVSVTAELTLESFVGADHVRAFFGIWFGVLSIVAAVIGPWVRPRSENLVEE